MSEPRTRTLALADIMILVALTGFAISCYVAVDNTLFQGQRYLFGLFDRRALGWSATRVIDQSSGVVSSLLVMFGGWTLALPVLRLRQPRPPRRRLIRQAGV